jgi:hypothetical protein
MARVLKMQPRRKTKTLLGFNLWLFDLVLTAISFVVAYRLRSLLTIQNHPLLPITDYLWLLTVLAPALAVLLPLFLVYQTPDGPVWQQIVRLSKGFGVGSLLLFVIPFLRSSYLSNRTLLALMLVIDFSLLVSYRLIALRGNTVGRLQKEHGV